MGHFDFIIVGAGSAGCVLANRLSIDPKTSVLLVEAGGWDRSPLIQLPRGFAKILMGDSLVWRTPVEHTGFENEPEAWVRGKVIGGSSAVNGQVYMRGAQEAYDSLSIEGWGWRDFCRAFRAIEDHELGATSTRGSGGALKVTVHPERSPICDAFIAATQDLGAQTCEDLNERSGAVVGYQPRTIWRGQRQSAAKAFLHPVRSRANLRIVTNTEVLRVLFDGHRATGIEVRDSAGRRTIQCQREVVLSAGALSTPKLLQLSGIGPGALLQSLEIPIIADAPQVGENLSEQRCVMPMYRVSHGSLNKELRGLGLIRSILRYAASRRGPLSYSAFEAGALVKSRADLEHPDSQLGFTPASVVRSGTALEPEQQPGVMICAYPLYPKSRGRLAIRSSDPRTPLMIDPAYLQHEEDRRVSVDLFRLVRRLFEQPAMQAFAAKEVLPGPAVQTDQEILDFYLQRGNPGVHALGTCRMGHDLASVVDPQLRVRGVEGLRVADLSMLPQMTSGNTNAPAMAIGWRAAELILGNQDAG